MEHYSIVIFLLAITIALSSLAPKIKRPYPILLLGCRNYCWLPSGIRVHTHQPRSYIPAFFTATFIRSGLQYPIQRIRVEYKNHLHVGLPILVKWLKVETEDDSE